MRIFTIFIFSFLFIVGCQNSQKEKQDNNIIFPILSGKYMGQKEPGLKPELFAPNIISTGMAEINAAFTPDYLMFYYSIRLPDGQLVIMEMKYNGNQWSEPEVASFSGEYSDADPFISYDGMWLYFISKRPTDSTKHVKKDWDIWRMKKVRNEWSEPERLQSGINSEADETYPSLTKNGKLYFSSGRFGKNNKDIFYADKNEDYFESPIKLNDTVNSHWEGDVFISADEDYMIFNSYGRQTGSGIYVTFNEKGYWSIPIRMSEEVNMTGREFCPIVSPDGKYFFFTSNHSSEQTGSRETFTYESIKENFAKSCNQPQMGKTDIYWADSKIILKYKTKRSNK